MRHPNARAKRLSYEIVGNVLWLRSHDPVRALGQSVTRLTAQIERSGKLKADIAAAVELRRNELYRRAVFAGAQASERVLARRQRDHVGRLLAYIQAVAAAPRSEPPGTGGSAAEDPLKRSILDLEASLERARQLSRAFLRECRRRD